jgi:hypothetical protein
MGSFFSMHTVLMYSTSPAKRDWPIEAIKGEAKDTVCTV